MEFMSEIKRKNPFIVACIPAFNEERSIAKIIVQVKKYVNLVIVCDDGSDDLTYEISKQLGVVLVRNNVNVGKGAALKKTFLKAQEFNPDIVVMIDSDGQHNPHDIPKLINPILIGQADVVIGSRFIEGSKSLMPKYRHFFIKLIDWISPKGGQINVKDTQSGFRVFSQKALRDILKTEAKGYGVEIEQLSYFSKSGFKVVEVPTIIQYRGLESTSKTNFIAHGLDLIDTILRLIVMERPLLYFALPGMIIFSIGGGIGIYSIMAHNISGQLNPLISITSIGIMFLGILLVITSMIFFAISRTKEKTNLL